MRSYIIDHVKNCTECNRYKPSNEKPSGLLRTPVYSQRFETISIDLFVDLCLKVHPERSGYLLLRIVAQDRIAIFVQNRHDEWEDKLPSIRFALNSAKCDTTGKTAAYLQFGREMRTIDDVTNDFRAIIDNENFVPEITSYLKRMARISYEIHERIEKKQDQRKTFYDKRHCPGPLYHPGDKVWVTLHPLSNASQKKTAKFMPKGDGPYIIVTQRSPTTYEVANPNNPHEVLGPYLSSALRPCTDKEATPMMPLRKRGRPRGDNSAGSSSRTITRNQRGSVTNSNRALSPGLMDK
ncbi:integrase catalytic domain-containing protein [Trichonephila clavipes]|nr:integrase catalytic domain-containing protein [Trichonephila clavipes]